MVFTPRIGLFELFSSSELLSLHSATLNLLERVGVFVEDEAALKLLSGAGAHVDAPSKVAKIPSSLVEESIKKAPRTVRLAGRGVGIELTAKRVHFGLGGGALNMLDLEGGALRAGCKQDVMQAARLGDALPNVDFIMSLTCSVDTPHQLMPLHDFDAMIRNTQKPIVMLDYGPDVRELIRMGEAVVGKGNLTKEPIICLYSEPLSPLKHVKRHLRNVLAFARVGLPVVYIPSPMCGATAPATVAGGLLVANAETLSGNVLVQLAHPGSAFIYGADMSVMDMRTGVFSYGAPEWMLCNIAMAQLGRYYGLPVWSTGGCSDAKLLDGQAAAEAAISLFVAASTGANLIHDLGFLDSGLTGSLELVTVCDELISLVERVLRGVEVNAETLALDEIRRFGPGGHFLASMHTVKHHRRELWLPSLFDRRRRGDWQEAGGKDLLERARERTRFLLQHHVPEPVPADVDNELRRIISEAGSTARDR